MRHLKAKPTEVIAADELRVLLSACTKEVITTMQRIEAGWRLRDEARKAVPDHPKSYKDYAHSGVCLAGLERQFAGKVLRQDFIEAANPSLWQAAGQLHGGLGGEGCRILIFNPTLTCAICDPFVVLHGGEYGKPAGKSQE